MADQDDTGAAAAAEQDDAELLDAEEVTRSLTGFEELAIEQMFRRRLKHLADDEVMLMRSLLFVAAKRGGQADVDAFRNTMLLRLDAVTERFRRAPGEDDLGEDADPNVQAEHDREYAEFVVGVGLSFTPDQFRGLTLGQRGALIDAARRRERG